MPAGKSEFKRIQDSISNSEQLSVQDLVPSTEQNREQCSNPNPAQTRNPNSKQPNHIDQTGTLPGTQACFLDRSKKEPGFLEEGIEGAIFDLDGTLVDSMPFWSRLAKEYLEAQGVKVFPEGFQKKLEVMTMKEAAKWFQQLFSIDKTPENMMSEMQAIMEGHYLKDVPLKPGVLALLEELKQKGIPMVVATATDKQLARSVLHRLKIDSYFQNILSCEQRNTDKNQPDIFLDAAALLKARPEKTLVFEDAWHAMKTALSAGLILAAVRDDSAIKDREKMEANAAWLVDLDTETPLWQAAGNRVDFSGRHR